MDESPTHQSLEKIHTHPKRELFRPLRQTAKSGRSAVTELTA
ncbi:MAG: hypothetical protein EDM05_55990 (plasmid) [Leptolyngbya sp. IPPAS B-1204]